MTETVSKNAKTITSEDYDAVVATVANYGEGLRLGSWDRISQAFDAQAIKYGVTDEGVLDRGKPADLGAFVEQFGPSPELKVRIDVLGITPTTAAVRIEMEAAVTGASFTDFHSLVKVDGAWTVIAKVWHKYDA